MWETEGHHKKNDSFAELPRPTGSYQTLNTPKSGVVLWGKKSTATTFHCLWKMGSVAANLQQNLCLTASTS